MLTKRIIPCLDVKNGYVVKGIKFKNHEIVGSILDLASKYNEEGADELVFYDIGASTYDGIVSKEWVKQIAELINIPFCVAGGIKNLIDARDILNNGADKISINSPALANPNLIQELANEFGSQCVVVGIDSRYTDNKYIVYSNTGDEKTIKNTQIETKAWINQVQNLGAGEIVLNCMNKDGVRDGYDINQLNIMLKNCDVPLIASGGAGTKDHFKDVLTKTESSGALAASVFHKDLIKINELKDFLRKKSINIRY
ncbi:MAG: imidazole glycerol phosphate synthase subunit HisF [Proteobacteria bacterium]|nr:imidazole glycerol phosphate synthase subunit HisF [Pseudomonadota bacterium]